MSQVKTVTMPLEWEMNLRLEDAHLWGGNEIADQVISTFIELVAGRNKSALTLVLAWEQAVRYTLLEQQPILAASAGEISSYYEAVLKAVTPDQHVLEEAVFLKLH